jgi:hypothetical protein
MEEMKVREYGWWASYTYTKNPSETSCDYFKWGGEGVMGRRDGGHDLTSVKYKPI